MSFPGIAPAEILLPAAGTDYQKWSVIACDQFTSEPAYWERVTAQVGEAPSTLHLIQPEAFLDRAADRLDGINAAMRRYLADGTLTPAVREGFVLVERETPSGKRLGLVVALDLDQYDYTGTVAAMTRATEETVADRIPPRVKIREKAVLELPHVMVLIDDPNDTVIGALYGARDTLRPLYDFSLMEQGGHLRGWAVEDPASLGGVEKALTRLWQAGDGFLYAVGDGNHSLATAKTCWETVKKGLTDEEKATHPARYALVELVNLYSEALIFEPIHRVLFGTDAECVIGGFPGWLAAHGASAVPGEEIRFVTGAGETALSVNDPSGRLPLALLQNYLDEYLAAHPGGKIDYVHGDDSVASLIRAENALGIFLKPIAKNSFFSFIAKGGSLPRKTFSMGEAREKRYYTEARRIQPVRIHEYFNKA